LGYYVTLPEFSPSAINQKLLLSEYINHENRLWLVSTWKIAGNWVETTRRVGGESALMRKVAGQPHGTGVTSRDSPTTWEDDVELCMWV
jgi:hypothetical protein